MAVIVETEELLRTVAASVIAGVGITTAFSLSIWGAARFVELSRAERRIAAGGAATIGILALAVTLGAVAAGIVVMTGK
jgi:uncharacterized membrane protein YidH (DUF202 family)